MKKFSTLFILTVVLSALAMPTFAQQRGMKIIANDKSGVPKEIPLYNKSYAVIIGIDRYRNLDYNLQLKNAVSDAKGVQQVLAEKYQFDKFYTLFNEEATKESILKTLQGDLAGAGKDDALFVFYAGHGYTQTTQFGDEVGYIVPHDGSMKDNEMYKNISMVELRDNIAKTLNAKHIFFVMDACYSGTLLRRGSTTKEQAVDYDYLKTITETPVRQVLTAGGKNEQVLDGGYKNHSIFTGRLIEKLEKAENYITATELGSYVPKKVIIDASDRNHKQNPQFGYLLGEGDFVFIAKSMQNVNSEDVLAQELKKLQEENARLENAKKDKELQENQRKQDEVRRQMALLEEKKKLAELEKARKEEEQRKALEEEKRKKELLAKIELEKQKQASSYAEDFSYKDALKKITELKTKIAQVEKEYDEQKAKAIKLVIDESPRGEFETKQEYEQRLQNNRLKTKQVSDEYEALKASNKKIYTDELQSVTSRKYTIGKDKLTVKLGTYDIDNQYFPVTVTEVKEYDPCDKNPIQNYVSSKIYIARDGAKMLRENEALLDIKATLLVSADEKLMIDKITLIDAANNKNYDFTANMRISAEGASSGIAILPGDCNRMVLIKGGTFDMGDVWGDGYSDERPVHTVTVSDFYMSKYEVTQKLWKEVMGNNPSGFSGCDDCPVEKVSWNDIQDFLKKLNRKTGKKYRLPYEAEWEYAAREGGKKDYKYSGSNNADGVAWYDDNSGSKTHPVGQKQPNALGLYDMSGNVREWCEDWYDEDYYKNSPSVNPKGPVSGTHRVVRGGSWYSTTYLLRASDRCWNDPDSRDNGVGFRLCVAAE